MSNQLLGSVYLRIMDDVIENCQTLFEEDGVNQQTLEDMRSIWQTKLTAQHVGTFPWEPPPAPQPMVNPMANSMVNPTLPSNVPRPQQITSTGPPASSMPVPSNAPGQVRVKTEPGYEAQGYSSNGAQPNYGNNIARERAAQNLQQKFGAGAILQINQLQAQAAMNTPGAQPQRSPMNIQLPPQTTEQQRREQLEYQRRLYAQQQQAQQQPVVSKPQADGADDWDDYVAQRRLEASQYPQQSRDADLTIRQQVERTNRSTEGGGLMMPLSEQSKQPQLKKRKIADSAQGPGSSHSALVAPQSSDPQHLPKISQLDGQEEEEDDEDNKAGIKDELFDDDDEDAINSDLDDPEDNAIEEEQDEGKPNQVMLCTYDKVQRVKNKWKCTLRDGVLNTGGKEYVFTKANGEFEW